MITKDKLQENLETFKTRKPHCRHVSGLMLSAGVNHLQLETGDWLIKTIAKYQRSYDLIYSPDLQKYQLWELSTATDTRAVLRCYRDHRDIAPVIEQFINPQRFPLAKLKLYFVAGVLMLSQEFLNDR